MENTTLTSVSDYLAGLVAAELGSEFRFKDETTVPVYIDDNAKASRLMQRNYENADTHLHIGMTLLNRGFIIIKCTHWYCCSKCFLSLKLNVCDLADHDKTKQCITNYVKHLTRKRMSCKAHGTHLEVTP
jgi:hypothetical protein